jgi:hypothetical protein
MDDGRGGSRARRLSPARPLTLPPRSSFLHTIALAAARLLAAALVLGTPSPARAQLYEAVGIRAQGMAGAFLAVADDATATWWNPAGLATGAFVSGIVEYNQALDGSQDHAFGVAFAIPSLGLSYYRSRFSETLSAGSTDSLTGNRQDGGTTGTRLPTHVSSQFGATVGQSIGEHLVLGSTLKLVRAERTTGDVDVGAMATFGAARLAVVVKNVVAADLTADGRSLERQARVGGAYRIEPQGSLALVVAVDADLTRTLTAVGDERRVTSGVELGLGPRLSVRGGIGVNTAGGVRRSGSGGVSVALPKKGLNLDAQITQGDDEALKGWGIGLRVTF